MQAAATFGALAAAGGVAQAGRRNARAQEETSDAPETLAATWVEAEQRAFAAAEAGDAVTVATDFPFYAVGVHWSGEVGTWPTIELSFSAEGATFSEPVYLNAQEVDAGRPDRDGRIFTDLAFTDGASFVRYRVLDLDDNPTSVDGLALTYIDATAGPEASTDPGFAAEALPTLQKPNVISRAGWGANESYRFDAFGEGWSREYREVRHAIIHHTVTTNSTTQNGAAEVRAIYYYHAVTRDWGDIGYNYLVDRFGNIYEGRFGGENVVGGHAYQYAFGSSGIAGMGTFSTVDITQAMRTSLIAITAWVTRNLDPIGFEDFLEIPNLPTICGHRDVTQDTCPGNGLYDDLPGIRQAVKQILDSTESPPPEEVVPPPPAEFTTGDNVITTQALNLRVTPSFNGGVVATMPQGTLCAVIGLARPIGQYVWYPLRTAFGDGWGAGNYLDFAPVGNVPAPIFQVGDWATVTQNGVILRARPGTPQTQIATLSAGTLVEITVQSVAATGHRWWGVYSPGNGGGWISQIYLQETNPPPSDEFDVGDPVFVDTDALYLRAGPGTGYGVIATMPTGTKGTVLDGPVAANGFTWWQISTGFGVGWAAGQYLSLDPNPGPGPDPIEIGDTVRVTDPAGVNLRATPSTTAGIIAKLPTGTVAEVIGGPQTGSGFTWYQLVTALGTGWAIESTLDEIDPPPPPPVAFQPGDTVVVDTSTTTNMRAEPSRTATTIAKIPDGTTGTVLAGPQVVGTDVWYRVQTSIATGWLLGKMLDPSNAPPPPPPPGEIGPGDTVRIETSTSINVRSSASRTAPTIGKAFDNETALVLAGPQTVAGEVWYRIQTASVTGWVLGKFLVLVSAADVPDGIGVGDTVVVATDALNLRATPGGTVLDVMPNGTTLTVVGGPQTTGGYTWWQVQSATHGTGWCAGEFLAEV